MYGDWKKYFLIDCLKLHCKTFLKNVINELRVHMVKIKNNFLGEKYYIFLEPKAILQLFEVILYI